MGLIEQLQPATYEFITVGHPDLSLPEGRQIGLIAQQVEEVIPELVRTTRVSAAYDEDGGLLADAVEYKAVNYIGLIPILIAAVQEQQDQLMEAAAAEVELHDRLAAQEARADELAARLDQLEQALALCCSRMDGSELPVVPADDLK